MTKCTVIKSSNGGKEKVHKSNSRDDFDLYIQKSQGQYMSCTMWVNNIQLWIQDFPDRGCQPQRGMEMKEIGPRGGARNA